MIRYMLWCVRPPVNHSAIFITREKSKKFLGKDQGNHQDNCYYSRHSVEVNANIPQLLVAGTLNGAVVVIPTLAVVAVRLNAMAGSVAGTAMNALIMPSTIVEAASRPLHPILVRIGKHHLASSSDQTLWHSRPMNIILRGAMDYEALAEAQAG